MGKKQARSPDVEVDKPKGGIEIVPLFMLDLKAVHHPYGNQYVSGPLMPKNDLTFPGVPVRVRSWLYVREQLLVPHTSSKALLGCLPDDMTLEKLSPSYRKEFGNYERWSSVDGGVELDG